MRDAVEDDLSRGGLRSLNCVLPRVPVKHDTQFRDFGDPTAVKFPIELDAESHR